MSPQERSGRSGKIRELLEKVRGKPKAANEAV